MLRLARLVWTWFLSLLASAFAGAADNRDRFEPRVFHDGEYKLNYRLLKPRPLDPAQKYPLVIFLHGAGERGDDNTKQLVHGMNDFASDEIMAKYPAFIIAPQCPEGQAWGGINRLARVPTPADELTPALAATLNAVDSLRKDFPIDDKRIYITGLSMGGYGTWSALANRPEFFAAAAPICGGGEVSAVSKFKHIPIWAFHGDQDTTVPPDESRAMIAALKAASGNPKYTEYAGVGHNSWAQTYADPALYGWLFAQQKK